MMKLPSKTHTNRKTPLILGGVSVLILGCGAWALWGGSQEPASALPPDLSAERIKALSDNPRELRETMRETMQRDDLTEEQRRELRRNMRNAMQAMMRERIDEYFAAAPDAKNAVLDKHIDDFLERMKEWEQARKEEQEKEKAERPAENADRGRNFFANASKQDRKEMSESRSPDDMARGMAYFAAVQGRMNERGIKPPAGPWGRGGPGGGFGGPGGGGRRGP